MIDIVQAVADSIHSICLSTTILYQAGWFYSSAGLVKYIELLSEVAATKTNKG